MRWCMMWVGSDSEEAGMEGEKKESLKGKEEGEKAERTERRRHRVDGEETAASSAAEEAESRREVKVSGQGEAPGGEGGLALDVLA